MSSNQNNIIPKDCSYGCSTRIYWNTTENVYFEVFSQKKHSCPNRVKKSSVTSFNNNSTTTTNKPIYYSKRSWSNTPKSKMSNSFELLTGPTVETIQKKYEISSDIASEYGGKVYGSQRDRDPQTGLIDLLVYYEVLLGQREEVKRKFNDFVLSIITRTN
jgi:hypothetical protein